MKKIGSISIDSGTILIGDPCYWLDDKTYEKEVVNKNFDNYRTINHNLGFKGKGIICSSGLGDGFYPVFAEIEKEHIKSITIKFF